MALTAVVFGGTGAVGKELVAQLAASAKWASVHTIGRRPLDPPPAESSPGKLHQLTVNMDTIESDPTVAAVMAGADSVFCALGTTRGVAGSADAFRKVDFDYVAAAAKAAAAANIPHFSLVSAQGASSSLPSSDFKLFHGLLYSKTKGQAEDVVRAQGFPYVTIMRPGLLERGELANSRGFEKLFKHVIPSVPTSRVPAAMIAEAERYHADHSASNTASNTNSTTVATEKEVKVWNMKEIQSFDGGS